MELALAKRFSISNLVYNRKQNDVKINLIDVFDNVSGYRFIFAKNIWKVENKYNQKELTDLQIAEIKSLVNEYIKQFAADNDYVL